MTVSAIAVVAALAVAGVLGYKYVLPYFASPEDKIQAVATEFSDAYNSADSTAMLTVMCDQSKGRLGGAKGLGYLQSMGAAALQGYLRNDIAENGTATVSVNDIHVTGDQATATLVTTRSKSPNQPANENVSFIKENGSWKLCE